MGPINRLTIDMLLQKAVIVRKAIEAGEYNSISEVICDDLRGWVWKPDAAGREGQELRAASGPVWRAGWAFRLKAFLPNCDT